MNPIDVKVANGNLYILSGNGRLVEIEIGPGHREIRSLEGPLLSGNPTGMAMGLNGRVYVVLSDQHAVIGLKPEGTAWVLDETFGMKGRIGGEGSGNGKFEHPTDVRHWGTGEEGAAARDDNRGGLYVSDTGNHRIQEFALPTGEFIRSFGREGKAQSVTGQEVQFERPMKMFGYNYLGVCDAGNGWIVYGLPWKPIYIGNRGEGEPNGRFQEPWDAAMVDRAEYYRESEFDEETYLYVLDRGAGKILVFKREESLGSSCAHMPGYCLLGCLLSFSHHCGGGPDYRVFRTKGALVIPTSLKQPSAIASAGADDGEMLYIADTGNNRVLEVLLPGEDRSKSR